MHLNSRWQSWQRFWWRGTRVAKLSTTFSSTLQSKMMIWALTRLLAPLSRPWRYAHLNLLHSCWKRSHNSLNRCSKTYLSSLVTLLSVAASITLTWRILPVTFAPSHFMICSRLWPAVMLKKVLRHLLCALCYALVLSLGLQMTASLPLGFKTSKRLISLGSWRLFLTNPRHSESTCHLEKILMAISWLRILLKLIVSSREWAFLAEVPMLRVKQTMLFTTTSTITCGLLKTNFTEER